MVVLQMNRVLKQWLFHCKQYFHNGCFTDEQSTYTIIVLLMNIVLTQWLFY